MGLQHSHLFPASVSSADTPFDRDLWRHGKCRPVTAVTCCWIWARFEAACAFRSCAVRSWDFAVRKRAP